MSRRPSSYAQMDDVAVLKETNKAFLCRWQGVENWVPKSMVHPDHMQPGEAIFPGDVLDTLVVKDFIMDRWFEERPPEPTVALPEVSVLQESERALKVRLQNGWEGWIPKFAVAADSPTKFETDPVGELRVLERIAREKGMLGTDLSAPRPAPAGGSARTWEGDEDDDIPF